MKTIFALLFCLLLTGFAQAQVTGASGGAAINKTLLLQLVNAARKKGCQCGGQWYGPAPALTWNGKLESAAAAHSIDMMQKHYFSHTSPDGSSAGQRMQDAGYEWSTYGENIAAGYPTEQAAVEGWLQSPGHCKNIMSRDFHEMGVARAGTYWTQVFGARMGKD